MKNAKGEEQEGIFLTAEQPPESKTEKGHKTGATSLPWTGELTEKEGKFFDKAHHMKVWVVYPLCTEMGGTGKGECLLSGDEIPFEEREGAGVEFEPKCVNGVKTGLTPSKAAFEGTKTEKNGQVETGFLESGFGPGYLTGSLVTAGTSTFELIQCK